MLSLPFAHVMWLRMSVADYWSTHRVLLTTTFMHARLLVACGVCWVLPFMRQ